MAVNDILSSSGGMCFSNENHIRKREKAPGSKQNIPVVHSPYLPQLFFLLPKDKGQLEERSNNKRNIFWKHKHS
jgi:hypothetical protein